MNKHIREHQTRRSLHGWHFDQMRKAAGTARVAIRNEHQTHSAVCAVANCDKRIRPEYLMCARHWSMVSVPTQRVVYATWRTYSANGRTPQDGNRYRAARAQAIAEVEQRRSADFQSAVSQTSSLPDPVCKHGTAMDVHCCNCHSGFLFNPDACTCGPSPLTPLPPVKP